MAARETRGVSFNFIPTASSPGSCSSDPGAHNTALYWIWEVPPPLRQSVPVWNVCIITPLTEIDARPNHLHMQQSQNLNELNWQKEKRGETIVVHKGEGKK